MQIFEINSDPTQPMREEITKKLVYYAYVKNKYYLNNLQITLVHFLQIILVHW